MSRWKLSAVALLAATLALSPGPAMAQRAAVTDPAGDAAGRGLDFIRVSVANRDHRIVVRARFVQARRGDLIVSIDPRGASGVRLISEYRPNGTTTNYVAPGAFTARTAGPPTVACPRFTVVWRPARDLARMTMPSKCLHGGDYGAVRFAFLSERSGGDTDYGPATQDGELGSSRFIPRG
jgi:hypothetical protein